MHGEPGIFGGQPCLSNSTCSKYTRKADLLLIKEIIEYMLTQIQILLDCSSHQLGHYWRWIPKNWQDEMHCWRPTVRSKERQ
jgi:hypothetical protein